MFFGASMKWNTTMNSTSKAQFISENVNAQKNQKINAAVEGNFGFEINNIECLL